MSNWRYRYPKRSKPRKAKGGIKAQTKRGAFGQSWWAKRWIEVLESFDIGARLGRGRSYARKGQVLTINIHRGRVFAEVQGSRARAYKVEINVEMIEEEEWERLARLLSQQAIFAAKLLAGEMPENIEEVFEAADLSLFPEADANLHTNCSCPDWSNPCKHIAAVYYLLGEEFDRDPFLIFKLRGMTRDELVELLSVPAEEGDTPGPAEEEEAPTPPEPLPIDAEAFWSTPPGGGSADREVHVPPLCAALPKRLGSFPFWRGNESFLDSLETIYENASAVGLGVLVGGTRSLEEE